MNISLRSPEYPSTTDLMLTLSDGPQIPEVEGLHTREPPITCLGCFGACIVRRGARPRSHPPAYPYVKEPLKIPRGPRET